MKISVITINYNNARGLRKTIESVAAQTGVEFEYIVVDGGSSDGSIAVLDEYATVISKKMVEKDTGPYSAMNKGSALASGEYLLFLNSGDVLVGQDSLAAAEPYLRSKDIYYANAVFCRRNKEWIQEFPDQVDFDYLLLHPVNHQNVFTSRSYLLAAGSYDEHFGIVSDWGFMLKAFHTNPPTYEHLPLLVSKYFLNGLSSNKGNRALILAEKKKFLEAMDPICGETLYKYVEICDHEYYKLMMRYKNKKLFAGMLRLPLFLARILARAGA